MTARYVTLHMDTVTDADKADLDRAEALVRDGKALRARVFGRLRQRKRRAKREKA